MTTKSTLQDLRVWDAARALAVDVHTAARRSRRVDPGLWPQACRSSASIGANIAEGCGRATRPDRLRFFNMALASVRETQHHLRLCHDLGLLSEAVYMPMAGRASVIRRMLISLMEKTN